MTTPTLFFAKVLAADGRVCSLACIQTHWAQEGSCVYERVGPDGKALEAIENGTWRIQTGSEADGEPDVLSLEFPDNGEVESGGVLDELQRQLNAQGLGDTFQLA